MKLIASGCIASQKKIEDAFAMIHNFDFHEIDLLLVSGWAHFDLNVLADDFTKSVKFLERLLTQYDLTPRVLNTKFSVRIEDMKLGSVEQRQKEIKALIQLMKIWNIECASIQPTLTNDRKYLNSIYQTFENETLRICNEAAQQDVKFCIEPHIMSIIDNNCNFSKLLSKSESIYATFDPSHLIYTGESQDSFDYIYPKTKIVHLRDARKKQLSCNFGEGIIDFESIIKNLKLVHYSGIISVEYEDLNDNIFRQNDMMKFFEYLRSLI